MITLADQIRAAADATAMEITPDSIPQWPGDAIRAASGRERGLPPSRRHVRARWLTPVAAAAAVLAVAAGSAVLATGNSDRPSQAASSAGSGTGLPRYYAVLTSRDLNWPYHLVIHDALTGAVLASALPPPKSSDIEVTEAADDTTFVIGAISRATGEAQTSPATTFYLARFDAARKSISMQALPIPPLPPSAMALSPDGRELAVVVASYHDRMVTSSELRLYMLATGAVKVWSAPGFIASINCSACLSWGPGGILALDWSRTSSPRPGTSDGIWLLDTNRPAGSLLTAGRLAIRGIQPGRHFLQGTIALIDNGSAAISVIERGAYGSGPVSEFEVFSTRTGRILRAFLPSTQVDDGLLWANAAGTVIAGTALGAGGRASPLEWISATRQTAIKGVELGIVAIAF